MITLFQHGKDEPPGEIEIYLRELRVPFEIIRLFETDTVPTVPSSGLIVLGGQMSVNDMKKYPFLIEEKRVIRDMVSAGEPVLGICLGAQMIASAFGERVFQDTRERGWAPVYPCSNAANMFFSESPQVFHWHDETFTLPAGATLLATGTVIKNQAFRIGSAIAVQYHPEVTLDIISRWATELGPEGKEEMLRESENYCEMNRKNCRHLLDQFLRGWVV
jgi:GMP synthase (glutamine-hydrolysing)